MNVTENPNAISRQHIPARPQPKRSRFSMGLAWGVPILVILFMMGVLSLSGNTDQQSVSRAMQQATARPFTEKALVFAQADSSEGVVSLAFKPASDAAALANSETATLAGASISAMCEIAGMWPSPGGKWIALHVSCEGGGYVQAVETASGQVRTLSENLGMYAMFLSWSPNDEMVVRVDQGAEFAVYRLNLDTGTADLLPIPGDTYNLAYSPDGSQIIYSLTYGLGYGSQTWIAAADGQNAHLVLEDPLSIIACARWSPRGDRLAYIRMDDNNIPFTVGELWLAEGDGSNAIRVGQVDAGHVYEPAWSPDGTLLAFATTASGNGLDIWVYDRESGQAQPVTNAAEARYPLWLGSSEAEDALATP